MSRSDNLRRALAVDDDRINLLLLRHILSKLDVRLDTAGSGEEGLQLAVEKAYPLIFLDIMLPGVDGFEICRRLRAHPFELRPRIMLMTAMGEKFRNALVAEVGADGVFFKPIVPSQVVELVKDALKAASELAAQREHS